MSISQLRHDYVVFGATGFTGEFVVEELLRTAGDATWAVAGRDETRVQAVLDRVAERTGKDLSHVSVIRADVNDEDSLVEMAKRAKVVINVVGPYRFYGEPVVRACVENGASHVDISGEPIYLEGMQVQYDETAKKNGVYVVGACGFDSIPCDLGLIYARQHFKGDMTAAETVAEFVNEPGAGPVNFGTFHSMIYGVAKRGELGPIRRRLFSHRLPKPQYGPPKRNPVLTQLADVDGWCLPFLGSDKAVAIRTQYYNYEHHDEKPIGLKSYMKVPSLLAGIVMIIWGTFFALLANFEFGRNLLKKYPEALTGGFFSKAGPTREQLAHSSLRYWIVGYGYNTKLPRDEQHTTPHDVKLIARVDGPDPAYGATSIMMVAAAQTILNERDSLPKEGGVYSPGAAFGRTSIIERLNERGIKFSVVEGPTAI